MKIKTKIIRIGVTCPDHDRATEILLEGLKDIANSRYGWIFKDTIKTGYHDFGYLLGMECHIKVPDLTKKQRLVKWWRNFIRRIK